MEFLIIAIRVRHWLALQAVVSLREVMRLRRVVSLAGGYAPLAGCVRFAQVVSLREVTATQ